MYPALVLLRRWLLPTLCLSLLGAGAAPAQTYYKWTDADGVVHFSDQQPAAAKNKVEQRDLIPPPAAAAPVAGPAKATGEAEAESETNSGPPRIVLLEQESPHTGPSSVHISGKVQNVGGSVADGVSISISAVDIGQGNPCLETQADVSPSSLGPGEVGSFDSNVDSPCLLGNSPISLSPTWQR